MSLTVGNVFDIAIAILFILAIAWGRYMGLAFQVARLVVLVAAGVVARILANLVGVPFLFGIFFVIAFVVFLQVAKLVKIVDWIPVVGALDRAGGAVAGFFVAFAVFCILLHFLAVAIPQQTWNDWGLTEAAVKETYLLQVFLR